MAVSRINEAGLNVNQYGNRNVIINGAMKVAQRGTSETGIGASSGYFTVDRYKLQVGATSAGRLTMTQEAITDLPGFANCAKLACTTADTSIASGELLLFRQIIEGQDLQQFAKGTSDAKEFTVSFYVKGNASATYVCELFDGDNSRQISKTFSVTTSWTRVVLTFPADTTGAFADDNGISLYLQIWLHTGSNYSSGTLNSTSWASNTNANRAVGIDSFFDSTSRTFFITGVQIEVGDTATDFEHRSFDDEFQRCQRYFQTWGEDSGPHTLGAGLWYSGDQILGSMVYNKTMRASPTCTVNAADWGQCYRAASSITTNDTTPVDVVRIDRLRFNLQAASSGTNGQGTLIQIRSGTEKYLRLDAEL